MCNLATFSYQKCVILPKTDINVGFRDKGNDDRKGKM